MINTLELKAWMVRKGYNQLKLSKACGVSQPTISRVFREGHCDIDLAYKIISVLGILNPGEIFFA